MIINSHTPLSHWLLWWSGIYSWFIIVTIITFFSHKVFEYVLLVRFRPLFSFLCISFLLLLSLSFFHWNSHCLLLFINFVYHFYHHLLSFIRSFIFVLLLLSFVRSFVRLRSALCSHYACTLQTHWEETIKFTKLLIVKPSFLINVIYIRK